MTATIHLRTLETLLEDAILPAVRLLVQQAVDEVIAQAKQDLESRLARVGVSCADRIRLLVRPVAEASGVRLDVVVTLDRPDAGG